ncbi:MAG: methanogenesis marker 8 protein [Candidatus Helarchaeota archaeon]
MNENHKDRHVWEIGKGKVIISNGKVLSVEEPLVKYCPIHEAWIGSKSHTIKSITRHTRWKIRDFGLCTDRRILYAKVRGIGYGCSESFMSAMQHQLVDAVVMGCDGAGTVITDVPEIVQGIGGPMNALIQTSPIPKVLERLSEMGVTVLDPHTALLNPYEGTKRAIELGFQKIGVIVIGPDAAIIPKLRELEAATKVQLIIFVVHTTGIPSSSLPFIEQADIAHACASKIMREHFDTRARKKFGSLIPVYALSKIGQQILDIREKECLEHPSFIVVGNRAPPELI